MAAVQRYTAEQIVAKLRDAERLQSQVATIPQVKPPVPVAVCTPIGQHPNRTLGAGVATSPTRTMGHDPAALRTLHRDHHRHDHHRQDRSYASHQAGEPTADQP
jgi:hypothetical protein